MTIRVLIVDDDPLVRSAPSSMLGGREEVEVVGEAVDGRDGIDKARELAPHVVLMDIRMPRLDGLEATAHLHADPDPPRVIILTTLDADEHIVTALAAGADGFLLKDTPPQDILDAILAVAAGDPMLSPSVTRSLIARVRNDSDDRTAQSACALLDLLTERELDVARGVGSGLSNSEIAASLHLTVSTVKEHVSRLFDKLHVTNRVQIAICLHDAGE